MAMTSGWNKPAPDARPVKVAKPSANWLKSNWWTILLGGIGVGTALYFGLGGGGSGGGGGAARDPSPSGSSNTNQIPQVPAKPRTPPPPPPPVATNLPPGFFVPVPADPMRIRPHERPKKILSIYTNAQNMIVENYQTLDGRTHRSVRRVKPPMFRNVSDQLLAMALSTVENGGGPPMPGIDNAQLEKVFRESLKKPIKINDDDTPYEVERKEKVMAAREEMKAMLDEGYAYREVLDMVRESASDNAKVREEALDLLREVKRTDGRESYEAYLKQVNESLEAVGVSKVEDADIEPPEDDGSDEK